MPATTADEMLLSMSKSNVDRFERLLAIAADDEARATLLQLLETERMVLAHATTAPEVELPGKPVSSRAKQGSHLL